MLTEPTLEKLKSLRLDATPAAWTEQAKSAEAAKLSFDERLGLLVDTEWIYRENNRMKQLLFEAKLKISRPQSKTSTTEAVEISIALRSASSPPAAGSRNTPNVVVTGMTGMGKTYLAGALAQRACRKRYSALYRRAPRLFHAFGTGALQTARSVAHLRALG